ncbi:GAF domain-containing protein [candidate division KSB1 bacterium]|nr:GAF domain-containing protein [candidate division KSB1 bacterium]
MTKAVQQKDNPKEILSALRNLEGNLIPVERSNIYLLKKNTTGLSPVFEDKDSGLESKLTAYIEEGIIDWIFEENRVVIIEDLDTVGGDKQKTDERNLIIIPLYLKSDDRGLFVLYTSKPKHEFTPHDIESLEKLSDIGIDMIGKNKANIKK